MFKINVPEEILDSVNEKYLAKKISEMADDDKEYVIVNKNVCKIIATGKCFSYWIHYVNLCTVMTVLHFHELIPCSKLFFQDTQTG